MSVENERLISENPFANDENNNHRYFADNGPVGNFFLSWVKPYIATIKERPLTQDSHLPYKKEDKSEDIGKVVQNHWNNIMNNEIKAGRQPSQSPFSLFFSTMWKTYKWQIIWRFVLQNILVLFEFLNSYLIYKAIVTVQMIDYSKDWKDNKDTLSRAMILLGGFVANNLFLAVSSTYTGYLVSLIGTDFRAAITWLLYDKILRKNFDTETMFSLGDMTNLLQIDTGVLSHYFRYSKDLIVLPLKLAVGTYGLYYTSGKAILPATVVLLLFLLANYLLGLLQKNLATKTFQATDKKCKTLAEIFNNIRFIKYEGMEDTFLGKFLRDREEELKWIWRQYDRVSLSYFINSFGPLAFLLTIYIFQIYYYGELNLADAFVTGITFSIFQSCLKGLPQNFVASVNFYVSGTRIAMFLLSDEVANTKLEEINKTPTLFGGSKGNKDLDSTIHIKGNYYWIDATLLDKKKSDLRDLHSNGIPQELKDSKLSLLRSNLDSAQQVLTKINSSLVLKDIELELQCGSLVAVIGRQGSGKSSLLQALLGEMQKTENSKVEISSSIAYVSQAPWITDGTLRSAITFGETFDVERFRKVVIATDLMVEITNLPEGLDTIIGKKGIELNAVQLCKVALARALYAKKQVYLLDDPLGSLSAEKSASIFQSAIKEYLGGRTRVVTTQDYSLLKYFDDIVVMDEGRIVDQGDYAKISTSIICRSIIKVDKPILSLSLRSIHELQRDSKHGVGSQTRSLIKSTSSNFNRNSLVHNLELQRAMLKSEIKDERNEAVAYHMTHIEDMISNEPIDMHFVRSAISYAGGFSILSCLLYLISKSSVNPSFHSLDCSGDCLSVLSTKGYNQH